LSQHPIEPTRSIEPMDHTRKTAAAAATATTAAAGCCNVV